MDINIAINPSERSALMHLYLTRLRPLMIEALCLRMERLFTGSTIRKNPDMKRA